MTHLAPEVRQHILDNLTATCEEWLREVMRGFFDEPDSRFAKQLMLEAFAIALTRMASHSPEGPALVQTYIHELQDQVDK